MKDANNKPRSEKRVSPYSFYYLGVLGIFAVAAWGFFSCTDWGIWPIYLGALNVATFILFGFDKGAARSGSLRVPESVIFLLAVLGGTPAVLLSMHLFRHKTRKARFQIVLVLILLIQVFLLWHYL